MILYTDQHYYYSFTKGKLSEKGVSVKDEGGYFKLGGSFYAKPCIFNICLVSAPLVLYCFEQC